jgi:hypothetical protein
MITGGFKREGQAPRVQRVGSFFNESQPQNLKDSGISLPCRLVNPWEMPTREYTEGSLRHLWFVKDAGLAELVPPAKNKATLSSLFSFSQEPASEHFSGR